MFYWYFFNLIPGQTILHNYPTSLFIIIIISNSFIIYYLSIFILISLPLHSPILVPLLSNPIPYSNYTSPSLIKLSTIIPHFIASFSLSPFTQPSIIHIHSFPIFSNNYSFHSLSPHIFLLSFSYSQYSNYKPYLVSSISLTTFLELIIFPYLFYYNPSIL